MAAQNVCRYFKFGFCKFREKCRFMHISEVCEDPSCEIKLCKFRHPRVCNYFRDYNRCKFSEWCAFKHVEKSNHGSDNTKEIIEKLDSLTKLICEKDIIIKELVEKIKLIEEKLIRNEEVDVNVVCEENDTEISTPGFHCELCDFNGKTKAGLQAHIRAKHKKISENIAIDIHAKANNVSEPEIVEQEPEELEKESEPVVQEDPIEYGEFYCSKCKFKTCTNRELKKHTLRKHTDYLTQYPKKCELCEDTFEGRKELKKHMLLHSLERTIFKQFKCIDCRFLGDDIETMDVHGGKCCTTDFECGLCDLPFDTLENLETHLTSCEVYECDKCEKRYKSLSDIKLHLEKEHDKETTFFHLKMNRIIKENVDCKKYDYSDV